MTFSDFVASHCETLPEPDGDRAMLIADTYLRLSGQVNNPTTQRNIVDHEMRGTTYFQPEYDGACCLRLRPYAI